jgi:capsular polysaccharide biosynthesis protein
VDSNLVALRRGQFVGASLMKNGQGQRRHPTSYPLRYRLGTYLKNPRLDWSAIGPPLLAADIWSGSYAHLLLETLPRLWFVRDYLPMHWLLLRQRHKQVDYLQRLLQLLGSKHHQYVPEGYLVKVKNLIIADYPTPPGNPLPAALQEAAQHLVKTNAAEGYELDYGDKLYISRAQASRRRVINEEQVRATLEAQGFQTLFTENYTLNEQIAIMSRARYLVSPHGAGLANLIFMKPGGSVLEFLPPAVHHRSYYYCAADAMGHTYAYLVPEHRDNGYKPLHWDMHIDIAQLESSIKNIIK